MFVLFFSLLDILNLYLLDDLVSCKITSMSNFAKINKRLYLHNDHSTTKLGHFPVYSNDIQIIRMLRIQP